MFLEELMVKMILWFYQLGWRICIILCDRSGTGRIPDDLIEEIARCLLPDIVAYCESEVGKREFAQWQVGQQEQTSKAQEALLVLLNWDIHNKKQIRTNFDLRNSSDLSLLVTRTGIEPMLPP